MDDLDDELDMRYHRGVTPDVYYRIPSTESLDGALQNELERNASSLIPLDIVTEFVFAVASTVTIPVTQQPNLTALIEPQDFAQSIQVEYALCRHSDGKERLKIQRAISKSIVAAIEETDGFKYSERHAYNPKTGGDGARLRYVCQDSLENRDRKANKKKKVEDAEEDAEGIKVNPGLVPTHNCGGAIHIRFSIKREAINVVYKHNPIHRDVGSRQTNSDSNSGAPETQKGSAPRTTKTSNGTAQTRKRNKKDHPVAVDDFHNPDLDMSTSPGAPKSAVKKKRKKNETVTSPDVNKKSSAKESTKCKATAAPSAAKSREKATTSEPSAAPRLAKSKACIRCREKKIKCNEAKSSCDQCKRGLWTCQYEVVGLKQRSKNGCLNCKQRRRKCTEEKPSCAYCLKVDDDCKYTEYS
ncbi:uncharacterized protein EKO05_0011466 [Ascochyta rabiei]|uniref:Sequence-specific DNA binding RNA polymerase II transcription factor n=1 Tax=Didymella rabiei TaxID=5454 RepID=A0A163ESE0_DIDRA|nr:uncharacterized protein EKO05_0011466 [Ascochyta rabiei]KZM23885.1 sequence-specific DNA binding RNA polymerase II transcription factor [Ascochyta rabiei]UPX21275.1 hypothetical protein EKO05_0011466 [Ascochyta rabiei]